MIYVNCCWYKLIDQKKNVDIRAEWNIFSTNSKIKEFRQKWISHIQQQPSTNIVRLVLHYVVSGQYSLGQPRTMWMEEDK